MSNEDDGLNDKIKTGTKTSDKKMKDPNNRETSAEYKADSD